MKFVIVARHKLQYVVTMKVIDNFIPGHMRRHLGQLSEMAMSLSLKVMLFCKC